MQSTWKEIRADPDCHKLQVSLFGHRRIPIWVCGNEVKATIYYRRHSPFGEIIWRNASGERTGLLRHVCTSLGWNEPPKVLEFTGF